MRQLIEVRKHDVRRTELAARTCDAPQRSHIVERVQHEDPGGNLIPIQHPALRSTRFAVGDTQRDALHRRRTAGAPSSARDAGARQGLHLQAHGTRRILQDRRNGTRPVHLNHAADCPTDRDLPSNPLGKGRRFPGSRGAEERHPAGHRPHPARRRTVT